MEAKQLIKDLMSHLRPPSNELPSVWSNKNRMLSPEAAAMPGKFRIEKTPYMREPMDASVDPECEGWCMIKSSQVAYSELLNCLIANRACVNPGPMMMMQPTLEMAEGYSKDRISPMIRDTAPLAALIDDKSRTSGNTILHKSFPGGLLQLVGANSPSALASRPIRDLYVDEPDRYPRSAGKEGDPITLGKRRQSTFTTDRLTVIGGTPTVKGASRIEKEYDMSDQRLYMVECPRCGVHIDLQLEQIECDQSSKHYGKYKCQKCGGYHENWEKFEMIKDRPMGGTAYWQPTKPEVKYRGYFIWAAYSPFFSYKEIADEYNKAKGDPELEQVFYNTLAGRVYQFSTQTLDAQGLFDRRERYDIQSVPEAAVVVTAGVDTQDNRFEMEVVAWGPDEESWSLEYCTIDGDPNDKGTRDKLDKFLSEATYRRVDGVDLKIKVAFIDMGGHRTDAVYSYVRGKSIRGIYCCKGSNTVGQPIFARFSPQKKERLKIAIVGTDTAKEVIYARLASGNESVRGIMHFPDYYDFAYFEGLISEEKRIEWAGGQPRIRWVKKEGSTKRNEPLDLRVYALSALRSIPMGQRLSAMKRREYALKEKAKAEEPEAVPEESSATVKESLPVQPKPKPAPVPKKTEQVKTDTFRRKRPGRGGGWSLM